jgi:hypothetical protein
MLRYLGTSVIVFVFKAMTLTAICKVTFEIYKEGAVQCFVYDLLNY